MMFYLFIGNYILSTILTAILFTFIDRPFYAFFYINEDIDESEQSRAYPIKDFFKKFLKLKLVALTAN